MAPRRAINQEPGQGGKKGGPKPKVQKGGAPNLETQTHPGGISRGYQAAGEKKTVKTEPHEMKNIKDVITFVPIGPNGKGGKAVKAENNREDPPLDPSPKR